MLYKVIISGSTSGIGKAIAQALLSAGHAVIGLGRDHQKFRPEHPRYFPYAIDFNHLTASESLLKEIQAEHQDVSVIIGNAGFGKFGQLEQFSIRDIESIFRVNFIGQALLVKTFLPSLKRLGTGKIILMGSESALQGAKQGSIYCASKFALRGFAQSLRQECRSAGISVTLINPGLVNTAFFENLNFSPGAEKNNALDPEIIAKTVLHLLSLDVEAVIEEINLQPMLKTLIKTYTQND